MRVTKIGGIATALMAVLWIGGLGWGFLYPASWLGVIIQEEVYGQALEIERIDVVEYGVYAASIVRAQRDAKGILQSSLDNVRHVETTHSVPARLGVRFGVRFKVVGTPKGAEVRLKKITIFPPGGLRNPASDQTMIRSEVNLTRVMGGEASYTDYGFDDPWELAAGPWTIEIWHGDRKLMSQRFTVFKP